MDENTKSVSGKGRTEMVLKIISDRHAKLMKVASPYYSAFRDAMGCGKRRYTAVKDADDMETGGVFDKPLPCFGCGLGWFSFLLGFVFPPLWYYATFLYFGNYYRRDLRERAGLAASAITAMGFSFVLLVIFAFRWFYHL